MKTKKAYKEADLREMIDTLYYAKEDAENAGDPKSVKWLGITIDFIDELLVRGDF